MCGLRSTRFRNDHDVRGRGDIPPRLPDDLSEHSFDAVARDGIAHLRADRDADAAVRGRPRSRQYHELVRMMPTSIALDAKVVATPPQPRVLREARWLAVAHPGCFGGIEAVSLLRPLARRRFSTFRPPGVAMRARNPCVRFRRRLLG